MIWGQIQTRAYSTRAFFGKNVAMYRLAIMGWPIDSKYSSIYSNSAQNVPSSNKIFRYTGLVCIYLFIIL